MSLPSQGIKDLLVAKGFVFGGTADWAVVIGRKPDLPSRCICIKDSGGKAPNPRWLLDYPSVQIVVRGNAGDYQATAEKCQEIKRILLGQYSQPLNGDQWLSIQMPGEPALIGFDAKNQPEFVMNFNLIIEPAATVNDSREPL